MCHCYESVPKHACACISPVRQTRVKLSIINKALTSCVTVSGASDLHKKLVLPQIAALKRHRLKTKRTKVEVSLCVVKRLQETRHTSLKMSTGVTHTHLDFLKYGKVMSFYCFLIRITSNNCTPPCGLRRLIME